MPFVDRGAGLIRPSRGETRLCISNQAVKKMQRAARRALPVQTLAQKPGALVLVLGHQHRAEPELSDGQEIAETFIARDRRHGLGGIRGAFRFPPELMDQREIATHESPGERMTYDVGALHSLSRACQPAIRVAGRPQRQSIHHQTHCLRLTAPPGPRLFAHPRAGIERLAR